MSNFPLSLREASAWTAERFGVVGLRVTAAATFYLKNTHDSESRGRIGDAVDGFLRQRSAHIRWTRVPPALRWAKWKTDSRVSSWLSQLPPVQCWQIEAHGGEGAKDASNIRVYGYGAYGWQGGDGFLSFVTPLEEVLDAPDTYVEWVTELAERLQPEHGYAGPCFASSPEIEYELAFQPLVWNIAQQHIGLDVDVPTAHLEFIDQGLKSPAWLVVLGQSLAGRIDPSADVCEGVERHSFTGGMVLRASCMPELGGPLGSAVPEPYARLAKLVLPLLAPHMKAFHSAGAGRMHEAEVELWRSRFTAV